jgi:hypothetical protein
MPGPIAFRNVVRYVSDPAASVPLYRALGFQPTLQHENMVRLANDDGVRLILHRWDAERTPDAIAETSLGFTVLTSVREARAYVEEAGFRCLREPGPDDEGHFYLYGDLDGNPIALICPPGTPTDE